MGRGGCRFPTLAKAAIDAGTDALTIEVRPNPAKALSNSPQSLTPEQFRQLMKARTLGKMRRLSLKM